MVQKPFSRIFSNVDDQSSANATEVRDNTSKKKRKAPLYETMSSENKNDGGLGSLLCKQPCANISRESETSYREKLINEELEEPIRIQGSTKSLQLIHRLPWPESIIEQIVQKEPII